MTHSHSKGCSQTHWLHCSGPRLFFFPPPIWPWNGRRVSLRTEPWNYVYIERVYFQLKRFPPVKHLEVYIEVSATGCLLPIQKKDIQSSQTGSYLVVF